MIVLCMGALMVGAVVASVLPFFIFACAAVTAMIIGTVPMMIEGGEVGQTALFATILLTASQIGYGLGLIVIAAVGHGADAVRRRATVDQASSRTRPLRTGREPR